MTILLAPSFYKNAGKLTATSGFAHFENFILNFNYLNHPCFLMVSFILIVCFRLNEVLCAFVLVPFFFVMMRCVFLS